MPEIVDINDIRAFIDGIKQSFNYVKDNPEMNDTMRYGFIKSVVSLRIKETKLLNKTKN